MATSVGRSCSPTCAWARPFPAPEAPYVWLGADVEPGTDDLGDGYTQETVEAFGTTLTVASQDPALRQHVLDSARATTDCEAQLPSRPEVIGMADRGAGPGALRAALRLQPGADGFDLVYAATLDEAAARSLYAGDGLGSKSARRSARASSPSTSGSGSPARTPWATPS